MSSQEEITTGTESTIQGAVPGMFCWWEAGVNDQDTGKQFYSDLLGWTIKDMPMGPDYVYTMFQMEGKDVAALYKLMPDMVAQGVPPHWMSYILVENADEAATKITAAGGTVVQAPFDVMDVGRMAVAQDPTGATFSIWQPGKHKGAGLYNGVGSVVWNELGTRDTAAASAFYQSAFGWTAEAMQMGPMVYTIFKVGENQVGGMMEMAPEWGEVPPHWMLYISVADCDATAAKAEKLGAQIMVPPTDIPNVGRFSLISDPQGAHFSILQMAPMPQG
jgi:predicted enzyme related to lactoylglutathione lyase